jgi:hypothetical protein
MSGGQIAGAVVALLAFLYGGFSLHQAVTGQLRAFRTPKVPPTPEQVKRGGWVAAWFSAFVLFAGLSEAVQGSAGKVIAAVGLAIFIGGRIHASRLRLRSRESPPRIVR